MIAMRASNRGGARPGSGPKPITSIADRRDEIIRAINADLPLKAVAIRCQISDRNINRVATNLGYRRVFITREEYAEIMRLRKAEGTL